jgi:hypothetical protein
MAPIRCLLVGRTQELPEAEGGGGNENIAAALGMGGAAGTGLLPLLTIDPKALEKLVNGQTQALALRPGDTA